MNLILSIECIILGILLIYAIEKYNKLKRKIEYLEIENDSLLGNRLTTECLLEDTRIYFNKYFNSSICSIGTRDILSSMNEILMNEHFENLSENSVCNDKEKIALLKLLVKYQRDKFYKNRLDKNKEGDNNHFYLFRYVVHKEGFYTYRWILDMKYWDEFDCIINCDYGETYSNKPEILFKEV